MKDMSSFMLTCDSYKANNWEEPHEPFLYNFGYYSDREGTLEDPIPITLPNLLNMLLNEIKERDDLIAKCKTTREVSLSMNVQPMS
jgi:hypothetical protein